MSILVRPLMKLKASACSLNLRGSNRCKVADLDKTRNPLPAFEEVDCPCSPEQGARSGGGDTRARQRRSEPARHKVEVQTCPELELQNLAAKLETILHKLDKKMAKREKKQKKHKSHDSDLEDSANRCAICLTNPPTVCTFPCEHTVVCQPCFVRHVQSAVTVRNLTITCVICRASIHRARVIQPIIRDPRVFSSSMFSHYDKRLPQPSTPFHNANVSSFLMKSRQKHSKGVIGARPRYGLVA